MPRIAEPREAAAPSSPSQKARYRRILRVAEDLAADKGLEGVQMHEIAKDAGVAIGTLYRYFPSKTNLFTAVMAEHVDALAERTTAPRPGQSKEEGVYELLVTAGRQLLRRPRLGQALLHSNSAAHAAKVPDAARSDAAFRALLLRVMGAEPPTSQDVTAVWLLMQCWYGLLISALNGRTSMQDAEADLRVACRLLLAGCTAARADAELPVGERAPVPTELAG
ncbi:TetR family transcriptional regulator [Blastococcus sp. SYSU D00820]